MSVHDAPASGVEDSNSNSPQPSVGSARFDFRSVAASAGRNAAKYIDPKNAATQRGLSSDEGGYLWTGELRFWDNQVLTGWYAAADGAIRSKGTMFLIMHPHGIHMTGRWVGLGFDDHIMTGWASVGKTRDDSEQTMTELIAERGAAP